MGAGVDTSRIIIAADSTQVRTASGDLKELAASGKTAATATSSAESSIMKMVAAAGGMAAVAAHFRAVTTASLEFSTAMGRVSTVMSNMADMPAMTRGLKQMAELMGGSAASQAAAMYDILSAGIDKTATALDMLNASNKLAIGGVTSVGVAADGLTTIMMAYGDQVKSTQDASDAMFVSAAVGKTTIEQLSSTVGRVIPIAANAGVSLDELLASIGALTKGGINTHQSVDGLRAMLAAIIKPSDDASKMAKKLGIDFNLAALQTKGWVGFIDDLAKKVDGNTESMAKLMGGIESIVPAMALTGSGLKDLHDAMDRMAKKAGETEAAVDKMAVTPQFQIDKLKAKMSNMMIETGDGMVKWLAPAAVFATQHFGTIMTAVGYLKTAIEVLLAMKISGWVSDWMVGLQKKATQMSINRQQTIALAMDEVRSTEISVLNAKAKYTQIAAGQAVNSSYIAQIGFIRQLIVAEAEVTVAENLHTAAVARLATTQSMWTVVMAGARTAVAALGGPIGILTLAVMGLYAAYTYLDEKEQKRWELKQKEGEAAGESATNARLYMNNIRDQVDVLGKAEKGSAAYENAQKKIEIAKKQLMALGPEYRSALSGEIDTWDKLATAIKNVNAEKLKKVNADLAEAQAQAQKPELTSWQKTKSALGFGMEYSKDGKDIYDKKAAHIQKMLDENKTMADKAVNTLLAQQAALTAAELPFEVSAAPKPKKIVAATDKADEKELEQLERFTKSLEHQAAIINLQKQDTYELDENYKKLTGSMKKRADAAIQEIKIKEGIEAENKAIKKEQEDLDSLINNLMPEIALEEKYLATLYKINKALADGNLELEGANALKVAAREQMTPEGKAEVKAKADLDAYATQLAPEDELLKKAQMLQKLYDAGRVSAKDYNKEQERLLRGLSSGFDLLVTSVETASGAMTDALVKFALTGKASFKDMTNAMLQDLARMMANKAMAQLLNFAVGAMVSWASGGGDGTDAADGFDGGGGGTLKANGGPVLAGSPYIVGEKRPELFVPSSNGTIIPDLGGGSPQISIQIIVNNDGTATTTTDGGSDNEKSKMMAEAVAFKIRRTIQEELAPGGDIHTFVTRG